MEKLALFLNNAEAGAVREPDFLDKMTSAIWFWIPILLMIVATIIVRLTFARYNRVKTSGGRTAAQIAREMLDDNGLSHIPIIRTAGTLTDHYNPKTEQIALSDSVHDKDTIGAIAVAAHEVGHAIQHATGYAPIKAREAILPVVNFCSKAWIVVFIASIFLESMDWIYAAIILMAVGVVFQIVTLPLEIDASNRAVVTISQRGYLVGKELRGAKATLTAAAFTYIVELMASVIRLLRLIALSRRR